MNVHQSFAPSGQALPKFDRQLERQRVHLIGIGGAGMSAAARLLLCQGAEVSGSDITPFDQMGDLAALGARITLGHDANCLSPNTNLVVASAAIPADNPELLLARRLGLRVIKYAELLGLLMDCHEGVAVAGTHGKSTTTALCAWLFRQAGLDPSFIVGASSYQLGGNSGLGGGPHFVVESCEYDRSFLHLRPKLAAVLNVEPDHLDCYRDLEQIVEAFALFAANVSPGGLLLCNAGDEQAMRATRAAAARVETFGFEDHADWRATDLHGEQGCYTFNVLRDGEPMLSTRLSIPGRHNVLNATAAIALAWHAGAEMNRLGGAVTSFAGISRRMMRRGCGQGVTIVDDYAHHPTEVRVTLEAVRAFYNPRRLWVVFQPHQYARTRDFMEGFASSFGQADGVFIPDIYGARETDREALSRGSEELVERIRNLGGDARYVADLHSAAAGAAAIAGEGDVVMTMGAGDVWKVADELVARLCR